MRVLLVDDDPSIRLIVTHVLRAAGHEVVEAADAESARAAFGEGRYAVVLMDVMLGDEDGIELAHALRSDTGTPIIFLTATTRPELVSRMQRAGGRVLEKPFDPTSLLDSLHALLGTSR